MKTIIQPIFIIFFIGLIGSGCDNSLSENVYSSVTEQSYNYTEEDFFNSIGSVYANMRSIWNHHHYYMAQATSADIIVMPANASGWNDGGIYQDMHLHSWNSESPQVENMWNTFYQGVLTANQVIAKIEKDILPVPSEVGKEAALSELK